MKNMKIVVMAIVMAGVLISGAAYAEYDGASSATGQDEKTVVDAGNAKCPVTGDKVDGVNYYDYKGKRYGLCCPMCNATFAGDPEKYAAIADKEVAEKK